MQVVLTLAIITKKVIVMMKPVMMHSGLSTVQCLMIVRLLALVALVRMYANCIKYGSDCIQYCHFHTWGFYYPVLYTTMKSRFTINMRKGRAHTKKMYELS